MQKGFPLILIALLVAIGGYFLYQQQTKFTPVTPPVQTATQPSPTSNETANEAKSLSYEDWKTYTNTEAKVSFQYPLEWTVKEEQPDVESKRIAIEGKEGKILLDYGSGFGGGCPAGYEDFKVGNAQTQACHEIMDDGSEEWSLSNMKKDKVDFNDVDYSGFITVNAPYKDNRDAVLKILSTFKFTP